MLLRYKYEPFQAEIFADYIIKMLSIYPQERPQAIDMLNHKWMRSKLRGFEHVQTDPAKIESSIHGFKNKNKVKTDPIFYRELKDFTEENNDADASFDMDDEDKNTNVGISMK